MPKLPDFDSWEEAFIQAFMKTVDEEPLYEYAHLYRKGLSPKDAVKAYLKENPDYLEKVEDLEEVKENASRKEKEADLSPEDLVKRAEALKRKQEALKRLSEFCPDCARRIGDKKRCKCGFKR